MILNRAVVSLGSNIDADTHIPRAIRLIGKEFGALRCSSLVRTKALGIVDQPDFTNGVVVLTTELDAPDLVRRLKAIETLCGRKPRVEKWGPREIDLDVLIWNGEVVDQDYHDREFLRQAAAEVL
jgi:2-amino-4-hydroxy-6-hydroxymethyldihydropteridine diphosphokinase